MRHTLRAAATNTLAGIAAFAGSLGGAFTSTANSLVKRLQLVPYYLSHLLYLLDAKFLPLAEKGYGGNPAVYACIRLLCSAVPEPPLIPRTLTPDGDLDTPLPWNHPLRQLIRRPNQFLTEFGFWRLVTLHSCIAGRSLWWKERDNLGRIIALWPLRPDRVGPIYGRDDEPPLLGWSYLVPGTTRYVGIPANDVVVFLTPDPAGDSGGLFEGLGPLQVLAAEVSADNSATEFVGALVANSAMPGVILQVPNQITDKTQAYELKQSFMEDFGGARRGEPMIVDKGATVTSMSFNLQQLEFPSLRKVSESRIAAAFGVPAVLVGLLVGLEAAIKATTDELRALFAETTCASYWRDYGDAYTLHVAHEFDESVQCVFDLTKVTALAGQMLARVDRLAEAFANGAIVMDEYREALDLQPMGDVVGVKDAGKVLATGIAPGTGVEAYLKPGQQAPTQEPPANPAAATEQPTAPAGRALWKRQDTAELSDAFDELMAGLEPAAAASNGHA